MSKNILTLTETSFDESLIATDTPVIVDFWAEWCGPCKQIAPILDEIAEEYEGKVSIGKLNVDDAPAIAQRFDVMSIPTLIMFENGEPKNRVVGAQSKQELLKSFGIAP